MQWQMSDTWSGFHIFELGNLKNNKQLKYLSTGRNTKVVARLRDK